MRDNEIAKGSENVSQNLDAQPNFNHQELQQAAANNMVSDRASQGNAVDNNGQIDFSKHQLKGFDNSAGSQAGNSNAEATGMQPASGASSENPQQAGSEAHQPGRTGAGDASNAATSGNASVDGRSGSGEVQERQNSSANGSSKAESSDSPQQKHPASGSSNAEGGENPQQKGSADGSTKAESGESLNHKNSAADGSAKAGSEDAAKQSGSSATSGSNESAEAGSGGKANSATTMEATGASPQPKAIESEGGGGGKYRPEASSVNTQETKPDKNSAQQSGAAAPFSASGAATATAGSGRPSW